MVYKRNDVLRQHCAYLRWSGLTLAQIGTAKGLSGERIRMLLKDIPAIATRPRSSRPPSIARWCSPEPIIPPAPPRLCGCGCGEELIFKQNGRRKMYVNKKHRYQVPAIKAMGKGSYSLRAYHRDLPGDTEGRGCAMR